MPIQNCSRIPCFAPGAQITSPFMLIFFNKRGNMLLFLILAPARGSNPSGSEPNLFPNPVGPYLNPFSFSNLRDRSAPVRDIVSKFVTS